MAYPINTGEILEYLGFVPHKDFATFEHAGVITLTWLSQQTAPTEAEIIAAATPCAAAKAAKDAAKAIADADKADFLTKRDSILANVATTISEMDTYIAAPTQTNAGRDAQLLVISKDLKQCVKDLKAVLNAVKGLL